MELQYDPDPYGLGQFKNRLRKQFPDANQAQINTGAGTAWNLQMLTGERPLPFGGYRPSIGDPAKNPVYSYPGIFETSLRPPPEDFGPNPLLDAIRQPQLSDPAIAEIPDPAAAIAEIPEPTPPAADRDFNWERTPLPTVRPSAPPAAPPPAPPRPGYDPSTDPKLQEQLARIDEAKSLREKMMAQFNAGQLPGQIEARDAARNMQAAKTGAFGGRIGGLPIGQQMEMNRKNDAYYATTSEMNPERQQPLDARWEMLRRGRGLSGNPMDQLQQIVEQKQEFDPRARQQEMMRGSGQFAIPRGNSNDLPSGTRVEKNERGGIRLVGNGNAYRDDPERVKMVNENRKQKSYERGVQNLQKRQLGGDPKRALAASVLLDKIRSGPAEVDELGTYIRQVSNMNIPDNVKSGLILVKQKQIGEERLARIEMEAALAKAGIAPSAGGAGAAATTAGGPPKPEKPALPDPRKKANQKTVDQKKQEEEEEEDRRNSPVKALINDGLNAADKFIGEKYKPYKPVPGYFGFSG